MEAIELAEATAGALPSRVRKVLEAARDNGWQLNGQGATLCLRLDHPSDELAVPVYVTWQLGETDKGNLSCRFMSAATATLQPLGPDDVLKYLADVTIIYPEVAVDDQSSDSPDPRSTAA